MKIFQTLLSILTISSLCFGVPGVEASTNFAPGIVINAVGDIMLSGSGSGTYTRKGYDYPFAATSAELNSADITVGNLEAPLANSGKEFRNKKFRFRIHPKAAPALKRAGFSVLTLANNHMMDFGAAGLRQTLQHLEKAKILHTGAGDNASAARKPAVIAVKGKIVAFLAYSMTLPSEFYAGPRRPGTASGCTPDVMKDIIQAKNSANHVVVSFHWGGESMAFPKPYQVSTAQRAIDAGADVVIGHHPHVLQGIEYYRKGVILYSLGNFAFGSMSRNSKSSMIARIYIDNDGVRAEVIPLSVLNGRVKFQPRILRMENGAAVISELNSHSERFGTVISAVDGRYLAKRIPPVVTVGGIRR